MAKDPVPAVTRAFDILEHLERQNRALGLVEIATQLNIPRASAFRIIRSLVERGYIARSANSASYILGAKFLGLGGGSSIHSNLNEVANSFMYQLAETTSQSTQLGVLFEYQVIYIEQIRVSNALTLAVPIFQPYAVNLSAGGKVLVAHLDDERREDFLRNAVLVRNTPKSIVDIALFEAELRKVKERGYAIDNGEFAEGIRCVAAPIFDARGVNIASIGVTGHVLEMTDERIEDLIEATRDTADRISKAYGGHLSVRSQKASSGPRSGK